MAGAAGGRTEAGGKTSKGKASKKEGKTTLNICAIAIDGPAASGKSTMGRLLAQRLGYLYFDTGVMYRAATWAALEHRVQIENEVAVTELAEHLVIDIQPPTIDDGRQYTVVADGVDVTWLIRSAEVDAQVSPVSAYAGVRRAMVAQQRRVARGCCVVMVGRDIGTVVLPEADLKIYLDASVEERARRRWLELKERGRETEHEVVLSSMRRRDEIDSHRAVSPLRIADGAIVVDCTDMNIERTIAELVHLVEACACQRA
ncbi:MAG: (d)CMP kinase [Anaerolineae bacterium]|nr:(d)CMP kinase [Anaerolineae bacterium]